MEGVDAKIDLERRLRRIFIRAELTGEELLILWARLNGMTLAQIGQRVGRSESSLSDRIDKISERLRLAWNKDNDPLVRARERRFPTSETAPARENR
jgi:hypothetical protein